MANILLVNCRSWLTVHFGALTLLAAIGLSGCTAPDSAESTPEPIGDFKLGFAVVHAHEAKRFPGSREAEPAEMETAMKSAITEHFKRFDGGKFYHIAATVTAYNIGNRGIPLIASPASTLSVDVWLWDDATKAIVNETPHSLLVREPVSTGSVIGSGYFFSKQQQLEVLGRETAMAIEAWLRSDESPIPAN